MNPNLLDITALSPRGESTLGLTLEDLPVNRELAPFLVSSTRSVAWVPYASKNNTVRAAIRSRENIESELVAAVVLMGQEAQWGNIHPLTTEGVQACVAHVKDYVDVPVEIIISSETDVDEVEFPEGVQLTTARWAPLDCAVIVPVDRTYLGTLWVIGRERVAALVHNVSRGMAVAVAW